MFDGIYKNDERHGQGTFQYPNGDCYQGNFYNGKRHGQGTFVFCNKTRQYQGEWNTGKYHGRGRLRWQAKPKDGPLEVHLYEGEFANDVFHGVGAHEVNGKLNLYGLWDKGAFRQPLQVPRPESSTDHNKKPGNDETANVETPSEHTNNGQEKAPTKEEVETPPNNDEEGLLTIPADSSELEEVTQCVTPSHDDDITESNGEYKEEAAGISTIPQTSEGDAIPGPGVEDALAAITTFAESYNVEESETKVSAPPIIMDEPPLPPTSRPSTSTVIKQAVPTLATETLNHDVDEHKTNKPASLVTKDSCEESATNGQEEDLVDDNESEPVAAVSSENENGIDDVTLSFGLPTLATYEVGKGISLNISRGSVVEFDCPRDGAIVNAANEGCLGGGGVDGAISQAGGASLIQARFALPVLNEQGVRCPTGEARLTGPGDYGSLRVPYVVHAVGPNYAFFNDLEEPDQLLRSAYQSTLDCCLDTAPAGAEKLEGEEATTAQEPIRHVAFSLLSSGIFRGDRSLEEVLGIAVRGIKDWVSESDDCGELKTIAMVAFSEAEAKTLGQVCHEVFEPNAPENE